MRPMTSPRYEKFIVRVSSKLLDDPGCTAPVLHIRIHTIRGIEPRPLKRLFRVRATNHLLSATREWIQSGRRVLAKCPGIFTLERRVVKLTFPGSVISVV